MPLRIVVAGCRFDEVRSSKPRTLRANGADAPANALPGSCANGPGQITGGWLPKQAGGP